MEATTVDKKARLTQRKTKTIRIDELDMDVTITKMKAGAWKNIQAEAMDPETGEVDGIKSMAMVIPECLVDPELTEEDVEQIDTNILIDLSMAIMEFSGLTEEGAAATAARKSDAGERGA